jgi:hypothetical protein
MRARPLPVTVAAILLVLLSLMNLPFPWLLLFPGVEEPPAFVIYSGVVLGVAGLVVAVGLWIMNAWSFWATIVVCVLNLLLGAPGVVMAPTAAMRATVAATEVVAALIIVLVALPPSRRALVGAERPSRVR